jgi:F0F1-type ATP synthase membrane subunit b/b'
MKRSLTILRGFLTLAIPFLFAAVARAAQEGGSPSEQSVGNNFKWIHFVIVAIIALWIFMKVLPPYFRGNADKISAAITKAAAARAEAERQLKEAATKLTSLEQEVAQFRERAQKDAAAELDRLRAMTKIDIEKVGLAAKTEIEAAERAARVELKALAAKLSVDRAESLVAKQMTPAVQEAMINNFVQSLQGRPN